MFFLLNREVGAMSSKGTDILSVEASNGKQEYGESVKVIDVKLYDTDILQKVSLVYPSEIMGMHLELEQMRRERYTYSDSDDDDDDDEHEYEHVVDEFEGLVGSMM